MDEVIAEFLVESRENLDQLDSELVALEASPDTDVIARIFRTIHTIKGTSGFLGFNTLESLTHVGENLLSKLRDGALPVTTETTTALLTMVDQVRVILDNVERTSEEGTVDCAATIAELDRLNRGEAAPAGPPAAPAAVEQVAPPAAEPGADSFAKMTDDELEALQKRVDDEREGRMLGEILVEDGAITEAQLQQALQEQAEERPVNTGEASIRVDVGLLDNLMNLVGELVLARNQILQFVHEQGDSTYNATTQRLNLITTELQEGVMKTRMQPIENIWNKFPRVVRDLSVQCSKQAQLVMEGKHTELDKTLLEAIKDPLTHLVRNAVDHGIEPPAERQRVGKPTQGTVRLSAYHEGGQVNIEISDDGRGIDPNVIRHKAVEKGLASAEDMERRSDRDVLQMIFLPGFSTAAKVSNISGRGVGMDVVRTNIEAIGGSVDVQTNPGRGTTFKVKIPLTLAIIPALLVTCGGDRYAIPQVSLLELVRLDGATAEEAIETVGGVPVYRLRGKLLPLVFLDEVFGYERGERESVNIVVLQADDQQLGLVVGEINDTSEIVVKPLGKLLKNAPTFAGATIMGDGKVALILDVLGIAQHTGVTGQRSVRRGAGAEVVTEQVDDADRSTILVFGVGDRRLALMLEMVARLEEFPADRVERAGTSKVVQYRDEILPLVYVGEELGIQSGRAGDEALQVVVYTEAGRSCGLVVDDIFDILEDSIEITPHTKASGLLGAAVIQGSVTDVLDVHAVIRRALPDLLVEVAA